MQRPRRLQLQGSFIQLLLSELWFVVFVVFWHAVVFFSVVSMSGSSMTGVDGCVHGQDRPSMTETALIGTLSHEHLVNGRDCCDGAVFNEDRVY